MSTRDLRSHTTEWVGGVEVADPFRAMEDTNNSRVQDWIREQEARTRAYLDTLPDRATFVERIAELMRVETPFVPVPRGDRLFFRWRHADADLPVLYVHERRSGTRRVLIDPSERSGGLATVLMDWRPSRDGALLAYALSDAGNDQSPIRILRVDTGTDISDVIPEDYYPDFTEWSPDGLGFWYLRCPADTPPSERKLHRKLYYHRIGTSWESDVLVFGQGLAREDYPHAEVADDGSVLLLTAIVHSEAKRRTEPFLLDLHSSGSVPVPVVRNRPAESFGALHRGVVYIRTNDGSPRWRIDAIRVDDAFRGVAPFSFLPEQPHAVTSVTLVGDACLVEFLVDAHAEMVHFNLNGDRVRTIPLPGLGSVGGMSCEPEGLECYLGFQSYTVPPTIMRYAWAAGVLDVFQTTTIPFHSEDFTVEQRWCVSRDGVRVPMFLVRSVHCLPDGKRPVLLSGYGGFNVNTTPGFRANILPFLERGGVYVVAQLRGGGEFGETWHAAGMRERKQTVFDDCIAAAESLIAAGWTSPAHLAVYGWSNGGLLAGAMVTQRPDLFRAAIVGAPVTDMLRYHRFDGGAYWITEYGHPEDPAMAPALCAYSPYHQVRDGVRYPAVLILTADHDDRVHPMHAYKFAARLQEANGGTSPILLRVERQAGHSGATASRRAVAQAADIVALLWAEVGTNARDRSAEATTVTPESHPPA